MCVWMSNFARLSSDWKLTEDYERIRLLGMRGTTPEISGQDQGKEMKIMTKNFHLNFNLNDNSAIPVGNRTRYIWSLTNP